MKKQIILIGLLVICGSVFYLNQNESKDSIEETKPLNVEARLKLNETALPSSDGHVASDEVATIVELEKRFQGLTEEELEAQIEVNNKMAQDLNLFELANSGNLDSRLSQIMIEYIRVNRVLNHILLDKRIEELEQVVL